jgi:hypothetical protein
VALLSLLPVTNALSLLKPWITPASALLSLPSTSAVLSPPNAKAVLRSPVTLATLLFD